MKQPVIIFVFVLFASALFAQEESIPDKQFMLGVTNVGSTDDASNLSSGIYFYTLQANNFINTNKMILIR